jgi:seryl-tRNA synthetase
MSCPYIAWRAHLDWKWLHSNVPEMERTVSARNMPDLFAVPQRVAELHARQYALSKQIADAERARKSHGKSTGEVKDADSTAFAAMREAGRTARERTNELRAEHDRVWDELYAEAAKLPNRISPHTPIGDETKAKVVAVAGTKRMDANTSTKKRRTDSDAVRSFCCVACAPAVQLTFHFP